MFLMAEKDASVRQGTKSEPTSEQADNPNLKHSTEQPAITQQKILRKRET